MHSFVYFRIESISITTIYLAENGRASHMLKVGTKRRRTNAQIEADHNQQKFEEIDARDSKVKMSEKD